MTPRAQLIGALSLVCTAVVLMAGARDPGVPASLRSALARQIVVPVAAAQPTPEPTAEPVAVADTSPTPRPVKRTPTPTPTHAAQAKATPTPMPTPEPAKLKPSKAGHVFVIALTASATDAFAAGSPATYLTGELRRQGTLLAGFAPLDTAELPNYIALTGGQPPNAATRAECATYADFPSGVSVGDNGAVAGDGCVYPNTVLSLADQVTASGRIWRAYVDGMDQPCRHPESGGPDDTVAAGATYATRHNPFVYFHSLLDLGDCIAQDRPLDSLADDLATRAATPSYAFIAPDLCDSGTFASCPDGRAGGLTAADAFLRSWVPRILASPAYRHDGALIVLFLARAPGTDATGPTKGLVVSRFGTAGRALNGSYDPYGALRSIEDLLGLDPLGFAAQAKSFARAALPKAFGS